MDEIMQRIEESTPEGADLTSWRYKVDVPNAETRTDTEKSSCNI
jgi:hypothetical protein